MAVGRVLEALGLAAVLALVAAVTYLPHADSFSHPPPPGASLVQLGQVYANLTTGAQRDYPYPLHVDENVHWVAVASAQREDSLRHEGLFFGIPEEQTPLSLKGLVHERGFHVALVTFQEMTGIPWLEVFRFLPALWMSVTAALLWAALRPWRGALAAAALVALIPTTARFLGPGFLVPAGFGLAWMAGALLLLPEVVRRGRAAPLLVALLAWAFFIHLIAGFAVLLLVACAVPFARGNRKGAAILAGVALLPVLALSQGFAGDIEDEVRRTEHLPISFTIFDQIGIPILFAWAVGCALVVLRPPKEARMVIAAATVASAVMLGFIVIGLGLNLRLYALYDRWHQPFMLAAAMPVAHALITAGEAGAMALGRAARRWPRAGPASRHPALVAGVALLTFLAVTDQGLGYHLREGYYHVLSDEDWAAFNWAAANVNATYDVFLTHPWKAPVLAALSGKTPHTYLAPGEPPLNGADYDAYLAGQRDGVWLVERDISVVVDPALPQAPEFAVTGPQTAQLVWPYAEELHAQRPA